MDMPSLKSLQTTTHNGSPSVAIPLLGSVGVCLSSAFAQSSVALAEGPVPQGDAGAGSAHAGDHDDDGELLQEVTVTGVRSVLHDKLGDDLQNTPQSVTVVSSELIRRRRARGSRTR